MTGNQPVETEDQVLLAFLAAQRDSVLSIVEGLDEEAWHRSVVPSGWTPAGLVEHLSGAELHWFQGVVAGSDTELPGNEDLPPYDPEAAFVSDLPSAEIIAEYRDLCAHSDAAVGAATRQARRPADGRTAERALGRAAHDRGDRATCRSPGHRQGADRRPDRARASLKPRRFPARHRTCSRSGSDGSWSAPSSSIGADPWRVDVGSRLAKPSRSDATAGSGLDAAAGSGTMVRRG